MTERCIDMGLGYCYRENPECIRARSQTGGARAWGRGGSLVKRIGKCRGELSYLDSFILKSDNNRSPFSLKDSIETITGKSSKVR